MKSTRHPGGKKFRRCIYSLDAILSIQLLDNPKERK
jgi:hypothetical protein